MPGASGTWPISAPSKPAREPGFSGELRRAILSARIPSRQLAERVGVDVTMLEDFRAGQQVLTSDVIDRLIATLGLHLATATAS